MEQINLPLISLQKAHEFSNILYKKYRNNQFTRGDIAATLGYSETTAELYSYILNLTSFGLFEVAGGKNYKLTKLATYIATETNDKEIDKLLYECFTKISDYKKLINVSNVSSLDIKDINRKLMREFDFSERKANKCSNALLKSISHIKTFNTLNQVKTINNDNTIEINEPSDSTNSIERSLVKTEAITPHYGFYMACPIGSGQIELKLSKQIKDHTDDELIEIKDVLDFFRDQINKRLIKKPITAGQSLVL